MTTRPTTPASDDEIRRAWQDASDEQPPTRVDAAILAAARRAAETGHSTVVDARDRPQTRRWFQRWQPMLAAAGVTGLAFALLQSLPRESELSTLHSSSRPSLQSKSARQVPTEAAPAEAPTPTPAPELALSAATASDATPTPPAPSGTVQAERLETRGAASVPANRGDLSSMDQATMSAPAESTESTESAAPAPPAAPHAAPAASKASAETDSRGLGASSESRSAAAPEPVATRIARIEALYGRGDLEDAAAALRQLRETTPRADELLPEPLRDWAKTVE